MSIPFLELFRSNPNSVVLRKSVGTRRDETGKLKAEYVTFRRGPSDRDVQLHFAGKVCLVAKPDLPDATCTWAILDFDFYLNEAEMLLVKDEIDVLKLPLHSFKSKSGGLHCAVFFIHPVSVAAARHLLENWKAQLGYANNPKVEVFPKPVQNGKIPFGIALPFFGQPEQFKAFEPKLHDTNGWAPPPSAENQKKKVEPFDGVKIPYGKHYTELLRVAGKLRRDGLEEGALATALIEICEKRCEDYGSDYREMCESIAYNFSKSYEPAAPPLGTINDAGNADLLVAAEGDDLRYCFEMKKWLVWDKRRWLVDEKQTARALMEKTMRAYVAKVADTGNAKDISTASACLDTYRITNGLHEAEKKLGVAAAELDTHPCLITFKNGTLELETMTLGPHKREHLITKMIHHNYDCEAKPSLFLSLLEHAVGKGAMPYVRKLLGYSITADTSEKTFIVVWGDSDTGKTTFLQILRKLLREYAVLLQVDTLMERRGGDSAAQEDLVALRGMRIATTSELGQEKKLSIAVIKRLVQGQGDITASAKYQNKITFTETHKIWFDTNHLPMIPSDEQAVWNRLAVVVFSNPVPKANQDKKLAATILREEAEGVLAWMVEGERLRQQEGLGEAPQSFNLEKENWRTKMNLIQPFIDERCERGRGLREKYNALYNDYVAWTGGPEHAKSRCAFTQHLANLGITLDRGRRYYEGLALVKEVETDETKTVEL